MSVFQLFCIQFTLLMILMLHSYENSLIIEELREIKMEISSK